MAIRPIIKYPSQVATDAAYPHGKAQNVTVSGDGTGTPLEKDWVNDIWGFLQALLGAGGITPSGTPDTATTSQYLAALNVLPRTLAAYNVTAEVQKSNGQKFPLTELYHNGGFTLASDQVQVPAAGMYRVEFSGRVVNAGTSNPQDFVVGISIDGSTVGVPAHGTRFSASAADIVGVSCVGFFVIGTPATEKFSVMSFFGDTKFRNYPGSLIIERVG